MGVSIEKAREFVYANGILWERAAFAYLFGDQNRRQAHLARLHQCLLCYKNTDDGWGHALEHDIKTPDSHPLALEYILQVTVRDWDIPAGNLFDGTVAWVSNNQTDDGALKNPPSVLTYPHAPWWNEGGQTAPDSITGNLTALGLVSPELASKTQAWAQENLTLEKIQANEWLFMAYHAFDYFMNVDDFPDVETYRVATIENIRECAAKAPEKQYPALLAFAPTPDSRVSKAMPELVERSLTYLLDTQEADGRWRDEHDLGHWQPAATIGALRALQRHGKLD
ncbi:MAG: hypothetical protein RLP44_24215 [Aggregatilineales bacterium]